MIIGVNCGHTLSGTVGGGAVGYLNESNETREVGYSLMEFLREAGHTVIDCTDDKSQTVNQNLARICELANAQPLDLFISIHFNAGGGRGSEAYTYGGVNVAAASEMLGALKSLGFIDRGIKDGSKLYVVRNTKAPACLLEVCFVDTESDAKLYKEIGSTEIARKLSEAISGDDIKQGDKKGDLTLTQYDELNDRIADLTETVRQLAEEVANLANPMIYNYIDDNMPEWARETIQKLVDKGFLKGDENGLNLTEEMLRILVILDRAGTFEN